MTHANQFRDVYAAKMRKADGPLAVHARRNGLLFPRLGLSVGRAFGPAVRRNGIKRRIREAFRHIKTQVPADADGSLDLVVSASAHDFLSPDEYRALLLRLIERAAADLGRRRQRRDGDRP